MVKTEIVAAFEAADYEAMEQLAGRRLNKVVRYLSGRLFSAEEQEKWTAVEALGRLAADEDLFPEKALRELLRRFFWTMNDESGAVPFGIPEAVGRILKLRPEFQGEYLPILCTMVTHEEMVQTGAIERGVFWALGQVGEAVVSCSANAVMGLRVAAAGHEDPLTRATAAEALAAMGIDQNGGRTDDGLIQL